MRLLDFIYEKIRAFVEWIRGGKNEEERVIQNDDRDWIYESENHRVQFQAGKWFDEPIDDTKWIQTMNEIEGLSCDLVNMNKELDTLYKNCNELELLMKNTTISPL